MRCRHFHRELPESRSRSELFPTKRQVSLVPDYFLLALAEWVLGRKVRERSSPNVAPVNGANKVRCAVENGRSGPLEPNQIAVHQSGCCFAEVHQMRLWTLFGHKRGIVGLSSAKVWVWLGGS